MPINILFSSNSKIKKEDPPTGTEGAAGSTSLDVKDKFTFNIPMQVGPNLGNQTKADEADSNKKIPWGTIPFFNVMKPIQLPKDGGKGEITSSVQKAMGTGAINWTTTTKVKQKRKELNMFSPSSF